MSLTFQNADSIKKAILEELENFMNPDFNIRNPAEERLKQLQLVEGYGVYLAEFVMNQSMDISFRQLACIMLKYYVNNHWNDDDTRSSIISEQTKKTIRNILPNGLYDQNSKIRSAVAHAISKIATFDWPEIWTELFDILVKCLGGNEDSIDGAIQVLIELPYDEKQIKELGPVIILEVYRIFIAEQTYSIKTRTLAIRLLKPLFSSISYNITNKQDQASMMNSVLMHFNEKLIHYLSVSNSIDNPNFILKNEILKVFTFLVKEMPKYIRPFMHEILPTIWQLLTQTVDIYVKIIVNETELNPFQTNDNEDDELTNFTTMIIQIFEFIQCIIECGKLRSTIRNVLTDLIYIMIVYIQVTQEQIEMWNDDLESFITHEIDCGTDLTIRLSGKDILIAVQEEFGIKALPSLSEAISRHLNVAEAEKSSGNRNWWKIDEASMVAVQIFKELILENENKFDLLNYLTHIRNLMNNYDTSPLLLGSCLWILSEYSKSTLYNIQLLEEILDAIINSLSQDKPVILKVCAIRAINGFFVTNLDKIDDNRRIIIIPKLGGFLNGILNLIEGTTFSVQVLLLETLTLIISYDNNFTATVHDKIIPLTISMFLKYTNDPFIILPIVQDILKVLCQNPHCLQPLQEKIIPTLVTILNNEAENTVKLDITLDALTTVIKYSQAPLSGNLIENAFPAVVHCILRTDDYTVMSTGGECLRAFIFVSPEQICSYKNGEGLNYIMQIITLLLNPMNSELTARHIGRLVITIITKMGNLLGDNIDLLLKAVISKMQLVERLDVMMNLVVIFAHLVLTQMDAVLNFLSTVPGPTGEPAMQFVFKNWLPRQDSFYCTYELKVTTMALCKLLEYGVTTQDTRLTSITVKEIVKIDENTTQKIRTRSQSTNTQTWITIPALVKMFKLLVRELGHLMEAKTADNESDSWTDDDDNDNDDDETNDNRGNESENATTSNQLGGNTKNKQLSPEFRNENNEDDTEDDHLLQELMKDPVFHTTLEDNLTKFLINFSTNQHFSTFVKHLNEDENNVLRSIQIEIP